MTAPATSRVGALDGLRGLAVTAVVCFHAGASWAGGGLLGVDVFLVLSGYLITGLMLRERERTGRIRLVAFWGRRARRLLPAMLVMLLVTVLVWRQLPGVDLTGLHGDVVTTLGYVANWHFSASGQGYFALAGAPSPLLHMWSLAVEEQFYLVWPLVVLVVVRARRPRRAVGVVAAVGVAASTALMAALSLRGTSTSRLYYGTDTRAAALLVGAGLAAALAGPVGVRTARWAQPAGATGLALLAVAAVRVDGQATWLYRGGFLAVALAAAAVLGGVALTPSGPLARLLGLAPLRGLGRISYGVYLWHWPVVLLLDSARTGLTGYPLLLLRVAVSVGLAVVSFVLVEEPVRRLARRPTPGARRRIRLTAPGLGLASLGAVAAVVVVVVVQATPSASSATALPAAPDIGALQQAADQPVPVEAGGSAALPSRGHGLRTGSAVPATVAGRTAATLRGPVRVLVEGDSVALSLGLGLFAEQRRFDARVVDRGRLGCGVAVGGPLSYSGVVGDPHFPNCAGWPTRWAKDVVAFRPDASVLLVGRWEVADRVHDGVWTHVGEPGYDAYLGQMLDRAIAVLGSTGATVVVLTTPCFAPRERADGSLLPEDRPERVVEFNQLLRAAVARHPGVRLVDLDAELCPSGTFQASRAGVALRYSDGIHIELPGAQLVARSLLPDIARLMGRPTP